MYVIINKSTGEYFIYIEEVGEEKALLVTPLGEIKSLELKFFYEIKKYDEEYLLSNNLINKHQIERYHQFLDEAPINLLINQTEKGMNSIDALLEASETLSDEQFKHLIEEIKRIKKETENESK